MNEQDMKKLIQSVCEEFYRDTGFYVTEHAVDELFRPSVPHLKNVTKELNEGRISTVFLRQTLWTILENARPFARERRLDFIGIVEVKDSMRKECPYVFWC